MLLQEGKEEEREDIDEVLKQVVLGINAEVP